MPKYFAAFRTSVHRQRLYVAATGFLVLAKSGGRFFRKAVSASLASSERTRTLNASFSAFIAALTCSRKERFRSRLEACRALAGFAGRLRAVSVATFTA